MPEDRPPGIGAPSGVTIHEASLAILRTRLGRGCDALLIRAGRGDTLAAALVERDAPCLLHDEKRHLTALLALRNRSLIGASTFVHGKDIHIPETAAASACGRRLDELIDVGNGGHQIIEGIRREGDDLVIDCREDPIDIPLPGPWPQRRAVLRIALATIFGYLPDGPLDCWHDNKGRRRYYILAQITLAVLILQAVWCYGAGRHGLLTSPRTQVACALIGMMVATFWPPRGWRKSVVPTISGWHSVQRQGATPTGVKGMMHSPQGGETPKRQGHDP
jgi:hypothetical protein